MRQVLKTNTKIKIKYFIETITEACTKAKNERELIGCG